MKKTASNELGASAVEYSLIVVAIAAVVVMVVFAMGKYAAGSFDNTCDSLAAGEFSGSHSCP